MTGLRFLCILFPCMMFFLNPNGELKYKPPASLQTSSQNILAWARNFPNKIKVGVVVLILSFESLIYTCIVTFVLWQLKLPGGHLILLWNSGTLYSSGIRSAHTLKNSKIIAFSNDTCTFPFKLAKKVIDNENVILKQTYNW